MATCTACCEHMSCVEIEGHAGELSYCGASLNLLPLAVVAVAVALIMIIGRRRRRQRR